MDVLDQVEAAFVRRREAGAIESFLAGLGHRCSSVSGAGSLTSVLAISRDLSAHRRPEKDRLHGALCVEATGEAPNEGAGLLLLWLFVPGLRSCAREVSLITETDVPDVEEELIAGFWEAANKITPRSRFVSRDLMREARRRALGTAFKHQRWERSIQPLSEWDADLVRSDPSENEIIADAIVIDECRIAADEVALLIADYGELTELATREGVNPQALWSRRSRARKRLRRSLAQSPHVRLA